MKVISKLANLDFQVGKIHREGNKLVVNSAEGKGIPTTVHIRPADALEVMKAFVKSPSALAFLLLFPLYYFRARREKPEPGLNPNNPWN